MARIGIDKAAVYQARQALMARGEHPSIDAVRIELGNTGSKTTIHRYLKELDRQPAQMLGSTAALSEPLGRLVERLAAQLQEEGQARIDAAEAAAEAR
ncbi:MAG: DNA-binding protein, partial [Pseudomonas sp.]|nr:DNA-binding protein [Pseudomonas sp.]